MAAIEPADQFTYGTPRTSSAATSQEVRDNFEALAQNHLTTDPDKPLDRRDGQFRVNRVDLTNSKLQMWLDGNWRTLLQQIQLDIAAPVKNIVQFSTASASWVVDHNLGSQVVAQVFDSLFVKLVPVHTFEERNIPLVRLDTALAIGPALTGWPVAFNGDILSTYAVVEGPPLVGAGPLTVDFVIDKTPGGGGPVSLGGGTITLAASPTGLFIPGTPVVPPNVFVAGATPDVLDVVTTGTPLASGIVQVGIRVQRTLNPGEYRLTQVNENRITIDHPSAITGFVVLVG